MIQMLKDVAVWAKLKLTVIGLRLMGTPFNHFCHFASVTTSSLSRKLKPFGNGSTNKEFAARGSLIRKWVEQQDKNENGRVASHDLSLVFILFSLVDSNNLKKYLRFPYHSFNAIFYFLTQKMKIIFCFRPLLYFLLMGMPC